MADILKVTTPLVNKYQVVDPKRNIDIPQFNLQQTDKVAKPLAQSELLMQHNGLTQEAETSTLLLDLLKDPSVTVSFLKNISMLQAMIRLMPMGNKTLTGEIQQLFDQLLLAPEELHTEMLSQEAGSTWFRGPLFDQLRALLDQSRGNAPLRQSAVDFLKALNGYGMQQEALDSVANNLQYLGEALGSSPSLAQELTRLSRLFRQPDAPQRFEELKGLVLHLLPQVEESILFSPKMEKVLSITVYNLSRYQGGDRPLHEALDRLMTKLPRDQREQLYRDTMEFLSRPRSGRSLDSRVMNALTQILQKQAEAKDQLGQGSEKVDKIIQSLLASPSNFTPLLHFVLPLQYQDTQSFMEFWVNPNGEEDQYWDMKEGEKKTHMLMVFDIGTLGRFEMELYIQGETIDFALFCPEGCTQLFAQAQEQIRRSISRLSYRVGEMRIEPLERPRSLMEVFRSLPFKRTGVDVRI